MIAPFNYGRVIMDEIRLYKISSEYLKFLHSLDKRISVKYNNRPFVGTVVMLNGIPYVLPLTSQTTSERRKAGKNKRAAMLTTFVRGSAGEEIANILHNNMFPVMEKVLTPVIIDAEKDTYEANEARYIRKHKDEIIEKARKLHDKRILSPNDFLKRTCCDFKMLEENYQNFSSVPPRSET